LEVARPSDPLGPWLTHVYTCRETKLANPDVYETEAQKQQAAEVLIHLYQQEDSSPTIQASIGRALGAIGLPKARPVLRDAIQSSDALVRAQACRALGKVGDPKTDGTLLARVMTIDISRETRIAAIEALAELQPTDPRIAYSMVEAMRNPDPAIRAASYEALKEISGQDLGLDVDAWDQWAKRRMESADAKPDGG